MARQPAAWATSPDTVRASRMPSSSPVMMRATTRPRRSSGARSAAKGIITCPATEAPPTRTDATAKNHRFGASGAADQGHGAEAEEPGDQRPARVEVAQGDDEQQAGGVADLGGRDDGRGRPGPAVEGPRDLVQDGLRVVEVGHHRAGGHGDEDDEATRTASGVRCGPVSRRRATGSGYRRPALRSDGAAAPALGGDAGQRGEDQRDADEEEPAAEDQGEHRHEGAHAEHEGPDGRAGERVDRPGAVGHLRVLAVDGRSPAAWTLPQKKYLWPWKRRCQKK